MKTEGPSISQKEISQIRQNLERSPNLEEAADLLNLAGNATRLKLLYLLENMKELCVCDLAEMLGVSVSAVSQHLSKLRAYGLVAPRRDAQTIYYRLTEHQFNEKRAPVQREAAAELLSSVRRLRSAAASRPTTPAGKAGGGCSPPFPAPEALPTGPAAERRGSPRPALAGSPPASGPTRGRVSDIGTISSRERTWELRRCCYVH